MNGFVFRFVSTGNLQTSLVTNYHQRRVCKLGMHNSFLITNPLCTASLSCSTISARSSRKRQRQRGLRAQTLSGDIHTGQGGLHDGVVDGVRMTPVMYGGDTQLEGMMVREEEIQNCSNPNSVAHDAGDYFVSESLRDDIDKRRVFSLEFGAQRIHSSLVLLPIRTVGLAMRDKYAAALAMWSEIAHSFVGLIHFPHHEMVAVSLHLVYSLLLMRP